MTMKKVKFTRPISVSPFDKNFKQRSYATGEIIELNDAKADHFALLGYVEIIEAPKPKPEVTPAKPVAKAKPKTKASPKPKAE